MMFGPKKVADVVAGFSRAIDDLQVIFDVQTKEANRLADLVIEAEDERGKAKRILNNFKQMVEGEL